jgi:hypothetical protein
MLYRGQIVEFENPAPKQTIRQSDTKKIERVPYAFSIKLHPNRELGQKK